MNKPVTTTTRVAAPLASVVKQKKLRVAAYARVSEMKGNTPLSLSAQVSHYNKTISENPDWEYAGVFHDAGISGTTITKRPGFTKLLEACERGQVDLVLTKSISRFARNTVDLLATVRRLKDLGVEVIFERENIHTFSSDGELMLSILASFAQEEARSQSENVKWGIRKDFERGKTNQMCIYGYIWTGEKFLINEEQARVVRYIYSRFLEGTSLSQILRELDEQGVRGYWGARMNHSTLRCILRQERYTGNTLFQKFFNAYPGDHGTRNEGQMPQYWAENTHPAIIDMGTWQAAQEELDRREEVNRSKGLGGSRGKKLPRTILHKKIHCQRCDANYHRGNYDYQGHREKIWTCSSRKNPGQSSCRGRFYEEILKAHIAAALGWEAFDEERFKREVVRLEVVEKNVFDVVTTSGMKYRRYYKAPHKNIPLPQRINRILRGLEGGEA